ncbi:hypothetical protein [Subtercola lobariae]|nr:hypothetical protein [Subtercola lobariae]
MSDKFGDNEHVREKRRRERVLMFSAAATYLAVVVAYALTR